MVELIKRVFKRRIWSGDYESWGQVISECSGYSSEIILQKQIEATQAVLSGKAVFERDTYLFYEELFNFPVIASLLRASSDGQLSVVDFGGALGSAYYQNKKAFAALSLKWGIVEQSNFVKVGIERFSSNVISFYEDLGSAVRTVQPQVFFSSCAFQYLESPEGWINEVISLEVPYILLDRIAFNATPRARLTKQTVPDSIYRAQYPCWFFNEADFLGMFESKYDLIWQFNSLDQADISSYFKGFFFRRKDLG
jgi:putative methyltransferase (TIGR04325 family)